MEKSPDGDTSVNNDRVIATRVLLWFVGMSLNVSDRPSWNWKTERYSIQDITTEFLLSVDILLCGLYSCNNFWAEESSVMWEGEQFNSTIIFKFLVSTRHVQAF